MHTHTADYQLLYIKHKLVVYTTDYVIPLANASVSCHRSFTHLRVFGT